MGTLNKTIKLRRVTEEDLKYGCGYLLHDVSKISDYFCLTENLKICVNYLLDIIERILNDKGEKIETFTFGKSYADIEGGFRNDFNTADPKQWKKDGIENRWINTFQKKEYDFLLAFAIITRFNVPDGVVESLGNKQMLTSMLESSLIQHYGYIEKDNRYRFQSSDSNDVLEDHIGTVLYLVVRKRLIGSETYIHPHPAQNMGQLPDFSNLYGTGYCNSNGPPNCRL